MKNDLTYWEKNKDHLQKHFLDWEEFVHAGRLSNAPRPVEKFALFAVSVLFATLLLAGLLAPPFFGVIALGFAVLMLGVVLAETADRLLHPYWMVQTTRAVYVCYGKDCELIFECSFSSFKRLRYDVREKRIHVELYSDLFPTLLDYGYHGIPKCGKQTLRENKRRKKHGLPLERRLYSLIYLAGLNAPNRGKLEMGFYSATFPADSGSFEALMEITKGFRGLERRDITPPSFLKSYKE